MDLFVAIIEKAILPLFEIATVIVILVWACLLVLLLLLRRQRRRIGRIFVATSYVTGSYCWFFSIVIAYRTLGLFWLIFGVLAGGLGVIPLAVIGEVVRGLWSSIPKLLLAIAMMIAPRLGGMWIASRHENDSAV